MLGKYRAGGSPQIPRTASMSQASSAINQGQMQGMMHKMSEHDANYSPLDQGIKFAPEYRIIYSQPYSQPGTPSNVRLTRESSDSAAANMVIQPSFQEMLSVGVQR